MTTLPVSQASGSISARTLRARTRPKVPQGPLELVSIASIVSPPRPRAIPVAYDAAVDLEADCERCREGGRDRLGGAMGAFEACAGTKGSVIGDVVASGALRVDLGCGGGDGVFCSADVVVLIDRAD